MRRLTILFILLMLIAGAFTLQPALAYAEAEFTNEPDSLPTANYVSQEQTGAAWNGGGDNRPQMQLTERISIPFGIAPILPLYEGGQKVLVSGHGGCTAGETVSVVISVTHTTGASAVGQTDEACSANLQQWSLVATVATGAGLQVGQAEAGGPNPAPQRLSVRNTGGGELDWQAGADAAWVTLDVDEGSAPAEIMVAVDTAGFRPGEVYHATIIVEGAGQTVNVPLVVQMMGAPQEQLYLPAFWNGGAATGNNLSRRSPRLAKPHVVEQTYNDDAGGSIPASCARIPFLR